jgi:hypothetical protein
MFGLNFKEKSMNGVPSTANYEIPSIFNCRLRSDAQSYYAAVLGLLLRTCILLGPRSLLDPSSLQLAFIRASRSPFGF